jgi:hypothetical protein
MYESLCGFETTQETNASINTWFYSLLLKSKKRMLIKCSSDENCKLIRTIDIQSNKKDIKFKNIQGIKLRSWTMRKYFIKHKNKQKCLYRCSKRAIW